MLKQLTERYIAAFASKNIAAVAALMAEDFALEDPVVKRVEGKAAALEATGKILRAASNWTLAPSKFFKTGIQR